jgi:hypothetical protein
MTQSQENTIQRCPHDKENPYAQINRELIRNKNLSPRCRWFIIFCLSFDTTWNISIPHYMKDQEISKDIMYAMLNEAIEAGYMKREEFFEGGLKRYKYFVSETPKFKKCLPCPDFPDVVFPDPENPHSTKEQSKEKQTKEYKPPTPKGDGIISFNFEKRQFIGITPADLEKWKEMYPNVNVTKEIQKAEEAILSKAKYQRYKDFRKFINVWLSNIQTPKPFVPKRLSEEEKNHVKLNLELTKKLMAQYPHGFGKGKIIGMFIVNPENGAEVYFGISPTIFEELLAKAFGAKKI